MRFGAQTGGLLWEFERPRVRQHMGTKTSEDRGDSKGTRCHPIQALRPGDSRYSKGAGQAGMNMCVRPLPLFPCSCRSGRGKAARVPGWGFPSLVLRPGPRDERADSSWPLLLPQRARRSSAPRLSRVSAPGLQGIFGLCLCSTHSEIVLPWSGAPSPTHSCVGRAQKC